MEGAQTSWINLVVAAGLDAAELVVERHERVMLQLWDAAAAPPPVSSAQCRSTDVQYPRLAQAAFRAITTLSFICPTLYIDTFLQQVKTDLDPAALDFVGLEERGIWITPADQAYVDG
jgi:hypothetical protein